MRELKFRVWSDYWKKYATEAELYMDGSVDAIFEDNDGVPHHEDTDLVVEFKTGIKDKNGKEIYEGDILRHRGRFYEVKFDNYGQFYIENKNYHWLENGYSFRSVDIWCAEGILVEIIGNIHENPELLGGEE